MYLKSQQMLLYNKTHVQTMTWSKPGVSLLSSHVFKCQEDLVNINEISNCCVSI